MKDKNEIINFIKNNKEKFQLNFSLIKPKPRKFNKSNIGRMINIEKYQTNGYILDFFYKKISRTIK